MISDREADVLGENLPSVTLSTTKENFTDQFAKNSGLSTEKRRNIRVTYSTV
jgi:hypothetical protein